MAYKKRSYNKKRSYKKSSSNKKLWRAIKSINRKLDAEPKKVDTVKNLLSTDTGDDPEFSW